MLKEFGSAKTLSYFIVGLNPYFNGTCSKSRGGKLPNSDDWSES